MANTTKTGEAQAASPATTPGADIPARFDPKKLYDVQLSRAFDIGPVTLSPAEAQTIRGDVCEANRDKIWKATINDSGVQELN
jgi:hypothetical protein